ncbi:MAG: hypothetical protein VB144_07695 [Clostridia bacterium]|nr:hypothetical protein [Clostridia bacterium]
MKISGLMDQMAQIESQIKELAARTEDAKASEEMTQYLQFLSRHHRYSLLNTMAIWIHCPHATHVAGYKAWETCAKGREGHLSIRPLHAGSSRR